MSIESSAASCGQRFLISISGRLDFPRHTELRRVYEAQPAGTQFDIELSRTEYLDSSALGMLLLIRRHAGDSPEAVRLLNPSPAVSRILAIANFDRLFQIVTS